MGKEYQINSDTLLWHNFIKGNEDAFRIIYKNYVNALYNYGRNFTCDHSLVKDCIQDVFVDLSKCRAQLGSTNNIKLYLFKSLKRKIIRSVSKKGRFGTINREDLPFFYCLSFEEEVVKKEEEVYKYQQLEKAMLTLSARQKEAIYLKFVSDLGYEELGNVMQINYQSARNLVFRGLEKLRESYPKKPDTVQHEVKIYQL